jgi:hypothetical protein
MAFVLAMSLMFSATSSQTKVVEAAACTMDISETALVLTTLVEGGGSAVAANATTLTTSGNSNVTTGIGDYATIQAWAGATSATGIAPEEILVTDVVSATSLTIVRGQNGTTGATIADNAAVVANGVTADNGVDCTGTAGTALTVSLTSKYPGYNAKVWIEDTKAQTAAALNDASDISTTDTAIVFDGSGSIVAGDTITVGSEDMFVSSVSGQTATVIRGYNATTAAIAVDDAVITIKENRQNGFAGRSYIEPTINAKVAVDTYAEARTIGLTSYTSGTANKYTGSFELSSAAAGRVVIAVQGPKAGFVYGATGTASENLIVVNFRGAPSDYVDTNANGAYNSGTDTDRSVVTAPADLAADTTCAAGSVTDDIVFDIQDANGERLVGTAVLTLSADAVAAGMKFTDSGQSTISVTTLSTGTNTEEVTGIPCTGNFRHTFDVSFTGVTGTLDISGTANGAYLYRTDDKVSTVTATLYKTATVCSTSNTCATSTADKVVTEIAAVAAGAEDDYYITVAALDSAGNPVQDTIKVKDNDGSGTEGLGTDITFEVQDTTPAGAAITSATTASTGKYNFAIRNAAAVSTAAADPATGTYALTFYRSLDATKSVDITVAVKSAAKTYTIAATSGQSDDGSLPTGTVGTWTVTAVDANGNTISANTAVTFIVTGLGTGATAGSKIPTDGALTVAATTGGVISLVAPTVAGTGTIAVIAGGKIVASTTTTWSGASAGATVSGTGCTASTVGSYTCVVTDGGTAAEVATASNAVSVWQSDANGVLQGYVVGTPDFVDTGLASTATIANNSAVIVVR